MPVRRESAWWGLTVGVAVGAVLFLLQGCSLFFSPPSVTIVGVDLVSVGLTSGVAEVTLDVANQRSGKLDILGFLYALEVRDQEGEGVDAGSWRKLAEGFHADRVVIEGKQTQRVTLPVPFEYRALGTALRTFLARGEVPYRMKGEVRVRSLGSELRIPFRSEGILKP